MNTIEREEFSMFELAAAPVISSSRFYRRLNVENVNLLCTRPG